METAMKPSTARDIASQSKSIDDPVPQSGKTWFRPGPPRLVMIGILLACYFATPAKAADPLDIGLEELLATEVTGASRKSQQLRDVAAAVFVLNREDIARSGATSIPDILRLVPGVQVAQLGNGRWAISARGFSGRFSNKLQVLMDGRSLYSPLFAGVLWETEDTLLEDIDRIEVIRGPGAAMWGANAVNGVINIVTRKARDTQGDLISAVAGTDRTQLALRHGATADDGHYRLWAKGLSYRESPAADGGEGRDDWAGGRVGYRGDWLFASGRRLSVIGGAYVNSVGDRFFEPDAAAAAGISRVDKSQRNRGAHLIGRHQWITDGGSEVSLQAYLDMGRMQVSDFIDETRTTADIELEHRLRLGERNDIVWGLEVRNSRDRIEASGMLGITPERRTTRMSSLFVQDEIAIVPEQLSISLGARAEHNSSTGFEPQPSARITWKPSQTATLWASAARATRVPSRAERDVSVNLSLTPGVPFPVLMRNTPRTDHELDSEIVQAVEAGYRHVWTERLSIDVAAFRNRYHGLRSAALGSTEFVVAPVPMVIQNIIPNNAVEARSHGLEVSAEVQVSSWWRLHPGYTYTRVKTWAASGDPVDIMNAEVMAGNVPRHQGSLRSAMNLGGGRQLDIVLRHVGSLQRTFASGSSIDGYTTLDARYAWHPADRLEMAVVGRNLGQRSHVEFISDYLPSQTLEVERSAFITAKWEF
jgi:iron complex outermembrane receptor protein